MSRLNHLRRFYDILDKVEARLGGKRRLSECSGRMAWPAKGVYFFFEAGELRSESGTGGRVVRVGTHAVSTGSKATLWRRLAQHRGTSGSGGNHRGSVFRLLVGAALSARRSELALPTWGHGQSAPRDIRDTEEFLEREVSAYIGAMPFLWLDACDDPSPRSLRAYIERNTIALLSSASDVWAPLDPASPTWLGRDCPNEKVARSGLWNSRYVEDEYEPEFLDIIEKQVCSM